MDHGEVLRWSIAALHDIMSGERQISAIRHPLGFLCFPVRRSGQDGICLHLWSDRVSATVSTTSEIHSHSWNLVSHVLSGRIRNELPLITDTRDAPTHRIFEVISRAGVDEILPTSRTVRHGPGPASEHTVGDTYRLPAGIFHRTLVPADAPALTFVQGNGLRGTRDLSLGPLGAASHRVTRIRCTPAETVRLAGMATDLLADVLTDLAELPDGWGGSG